MSVSAGTRLGPYEVVNLVGAGGMGEVYRARDTRLGRDVAVKILPASVAGDPERLARFEREARAVAALNHPNILTIHDVGAADGVPYVVTELLEGASLRALGASRSCTQRQVLLWAVQIARGLDAAHAKGIVHRDVKPANVFVTTDGRVKVLDFGLAKLADRVTADSDEATDTSPTDAGRIVGTVGFMSPEQIHGLPVDARTDIFSFGVLLYELLGGVHPFHRETKVATLTAILDHEPAELVSLSRGIPPALSGIVRRCLAKNRDERFGSARDLGFALEAVLAAPAGAASLQEVEEKRPYPGLMSFTEKDAAQFFGREAEARALWERLQSCPLSGVIGPSGAGKTSFVRAGVVASRPAGWAALVCTPGATPFRGLGQALLPAFAGDLEALQSILSLDETAGFELVSRWRKGHGEALLVVDQFEELFTLNSAEVQERFAALLGRLASEADVHVLVSLRDDFLMRSQEQPQLRPILGELTALLPLSVDSLRRALVEPAKARGYGFDDEALVGEMVESVEGARAALPLLAFAVSRLWEKRDREKKLLTRAAYEEIGGVAGALAQHAEATMDRIGTERQGIVREVFRNLVTAQGTRAVAEREELLSAFPERKDAEEVLRELIDARLLTSYEVPGRDGEPSQHRIEVVHESQLKAWPRLVRWQMQDEQGAVLRDQLKQAAHLWEEKGRTSDLLWTGTAFQEFELWRGRYAGALTALEGDFARAMAEKARRRRRWLTTAVASVIVALAGVALAVGISRQEAAKARDQAKAEALRAESGKLLALGRTYLEADPTAALAYARGSLGLLDTPEAREFVLKVLWRGPVARLLPLDQMVRDFHLLENTSGLYGFAFSPDGRWLATNAMDNRRVLLFDRDGGPPRALPRQPDGSAHLAAFGPRSDLLVTGGSGQSLRFWSLPDLREIRTVELGGLRTWWGEVRGDTLLLGTSTSGPAKGWGGVLQAVRLPDGDLHAVGVNRPKQWLGSVDPAGTQIVFLMGRNYRVRSLDATRHRILGQAWDGEAALWDVEFSPEGDRIVSCYGPSGDVRIWSATDPARGPMRVLHGPPCNSNYCSSRFLPDGRHLAQMGPDNALHLWDLEGPPDAWPAVFGRPGPSRGVVLDPTGRWIATYGPAEPTIDFWPLPSLQRQVLGRPATNPGLVGSMAFTADGLWLATCSAGEAPRLWPVNAAEGSARDLQVPQACRSLATSPTADNVLVSTGRQVLLFPVKGGPPRQLAMKRAWGVSSTFKPVTFDSRGERAAASLFESWGVQEPETRLLHLWDVRSGQERTYSIAHLIDGAVQFLSLALAPDGSFYMAGQGGARRLVLPKDPGGAVTSETVHAAVNARSDLSRDGRRLLVAAANGKSVGGPQSAATQQPFDELLVFDLERRTSRRITTHGARFSSSVLSPSGRILVTGDPDGVVRAGPVTGEEPHLLFGHKGRVTAIAISPDERWIATASEDALSIWPMPDVTKPPLQALPYPTLMAKLDALTNLRVVRDPASSTGWKLDIGPFPGWKDVPTW